MDTSLMPPKLTSLSNDQSMKDLFDDTGTIVIADGGS